MVKDPRLSSFLDGVNEGIAYFNANKAEAVEWIASNLDYSEEDAREWMKTVRFVGDAKKVDDGIVEKCIEILKEAGVVKSTETADDVVVTVR